MSTTRTLRACAREGAPDACRSAALDDTATRACLWAIERFGTLRKRLIHSSSAPRDSRTPKVDWC